MDNFIPRIEKLIDRPDLNDFEKTFLSSIKNYFEKKNLLTPGQLSAFEKIEAKYTDEALALQKAWYDSWDDKKNVAFKKVVDYYSNFGYYFTNIIGKVRANPEYVPTEQEYKNIVENKYAQKFLQNCDAPAKFQVGDLVQIRGGNGWYTGEVCIVLEDCGVKSWAKGGREYILSAVSDSRNVKYREADIKIAREKSVAKIQK